jgi:hypothetical protein
MSAELLAVLGLSILVIVFLVREAVDCFKNPRDVRDDE